MQAKNKFQKSILALSKELPPISSKQREWAYENCFDHYGKVMKKGTVCLDCGYSWKDTQPPLLTNLDGCTCPQCGRKLTVDNTKKRVFKDSAYFGITTTYKKHQLFRLFFTEVKFQHSKEPEYNCHEVVQRWISCDGKNATLSVPRAANMIYYDIWLWREPMELRQSNHMAYSVTPHKVYPAVKYLPEIKRNGFTGDFHGINQFDFYSLILGNSAAETFLKSGEIEWFKCAYRKSREVLKCWPAIKIALRHKQEIKDKSLWIDYIELLLYFGKDIRNPKVIFPTDLHKEHDRFERKKRKIEAMKALEREKQKDAKIEAEYQKRKGKYLGVEFSDGQIRVCVLQNIQDFIEEGSIMHHCVFTNSYYSKPDSLILSARIDNQRIETIELSLKDFSIIQSRGKNNQNTPYHERIVELVEKNVGIIKRGGQRKVRNKTHEMQSA